MKGIRKLFLGLVLLTLFGVGFKVDVKAAPTTPLLTWASAPSDWNSGSLVLNLTVAESDFPNISTDDPNYESAAY